MFDHVPIAGQLLGDRDRVLRGRTDEIEGPHNEGTDNGAKDESAECREPAFHVLQDLQNVKTNHARGVADLLPEIGLPRLRRAEAPWFARNATGEEQTAQGN